MNSMKKNMVFLMLLALTASSCKKWLELTPQDGIIKEEFWKTKEQVQSAVVGIYSSMQEPSPTGNAYGRTSYIPSLSEQLFVWGECRADNVAPATFTSIDDIDLVNVNIQPVNVPALSGVCKPCSDGRFFRHLLASTSNRFTVQHEITVQFN